jgi:hypothetical protein
LDDKGQCTSFAYWQWEGDWIRLLAVQYHIRLDSVGGAKAWSKANAQVVYEAIQNIDLAVGGQLADKLKGANVVFRMEEQPPVPGRSHSYSGWTHGTRIDFYTEGNDLLRRQNVYHEVGHMLDNVSNLAQFAGDLGGSNPSWIEGNAFAPDVLKSSSVYDPNWRTADAVQHPNPTPAEVWGELWADSFANYLAGNINVRSVAGLEMYRWMRDELTVSFSGP